MHLIQNGNINVFLSYWLKLKWCHWLWSSWFFVISLCYVFWQSAVFRIYSLADVLLLLIYFFFKQVNLFYLLNLPTRASVECCAPVVRMFGAWRYGFDSMGSQRDLILKVASVLWYRPVMNYQTNRSTNFVITLVVVIKERSSTLQYVKRPVPVVRWIWLLANVK